MYQYEDLQTLYEDINTHYENIRQDCFGGLYKLFTATYPNHTNDDLKEVFMVIAWELCKVKAEIGKLAYLRDPDRIPDQFIAPLAQMFGITEFPNQAFPDEQRRYLSFAYELQKYKGTRYGLELLLKSLLPFDSIELLPMYRRGLRTFYPNNDYTGGRMAGTQTASLLARLSAGYPVDWRTAGSTTYPTGIYICITKTGSRNKRVIEGAVARITPIINAFMPESSFYKVLIVSSLVDPYAVTVNQSEVTFGGDILTYGRTPDDTEIPETAQVVNILDEGELETLLVDGEVLYYNVE